MITPEDVPTQVRIGPFTYSISAFTPMEAEKFGMMGYHHFTSVEIKYQENIPEQQKAHVIMHEILHAIWSASSLREDDDREQEERYVLALGKRLSEFIQDNPRVIAWMSQVLSPDDTRYVLEAVPVEP